VSSLRKKYQGWGHEIKNRRLFGAELEASEVKVYYLSPEELEKYRKGVNDMPAKLPVPSRDELIELIKSHKGSINAMAKVKGVGWNIMKKWLEHYDLVKEAVSEQENARKEESLKKLEELKKLAQAREEAGATPTEEPTDDNDIEPEEKHGAIIHFNGTDKVETFKDLQAALTYIENNLSKKQAQQTTLYQRVPFSFGVNVVPGEVS